MSLGKTVRRLAGPLEPRIAEGYRRFFIDLDDLGRSLARLGPVKTILEIGAGDGCLATRLCSAFPDARYLGVDIAAESGRLFVGDRGRTEFRCIAVEDLPTGDIFDLVVVVDVLHHVPLEQRAGLIASAGARVRPGGMLVVKDWERRRNVSHALCYASERFISGDRNVAYFDHGELPQLLARTLPDNVLIFEARVPPRASNLLLVARRPEGAKEAT